MILKNAPIVQLRPHPNGGVIAVQVLMENLGSMERSTAVFRMTGNALHASLEVIRLILKF